MNIIFSEKEAMKLGFEDPSVSKHCIGDLLHFFCLFSTEVRHMTCPQDDVEDTVLVAPSSCQHPSDVSASDTNNAARLKFCSAAMQKILLALGLLASDSPIRQTVIGDRGGVSSILVAASFKHNVESGNFEKWACWCLFVSNIRFL
jgi:hypothetical protein